LGKAADLLVQVRAIDPATKKPRSRTCCLPHATKRTRLLSSGQLEEGIFYLDQAAELRPLDQNRFFKDNWRPCTSQPAAIGASTGKRRLTAYRAVCHRARYRDTGRRLIEAYVNYGDQYVKEQDYCPAEQVYISVLKFAPTPYPGQAGRCTPECLLPRPLHHRDGRDRGTPVPLTGLSTGRLAYPIVNTVTGKYEVFFLTASGQRFDKVITGGDQPRSSQRPGDCLPFSGHRHQRLRLCQQLRQNCRPRRDGRLADVVARWQRIAYSGKDTTNNWRTYIVSLDAPTAQSRRVRWGPAWSSRGSLAYTGCGAGGVCGIFVAQPDQSGTAPVKLTADRNDIALAWSPMATTSPTCPTTVATGIFTWSPRRALCAS